MRNLKEKLGVLLFGVLLFGVLGFVNVSHAALNDLGNGLVNDTTLNITWMKDANLFKTLCDANDPIATGFTPVDAADAATVCTNNGAMTWNDAEAWVLRLRTEEYLGHNDWRQPITAQPDVSCEDQVPASGGNSAQGSGYNCTASELGNLFNISLRNPNHGGTGATGGKVGTRCSSGMVSHCLQFTAPFINAQPYVYWTGTEFARIASTHAWHFVIRSGFQSVRIKDSNHSFVWPVRGQSVVAPVTPQNVPSLSIWGLGIMSLLLAFVARRKAR